MADPQTENGHIEIANELWEAITRQRLSGSEFQVLFAILRKTYGFKKKSDWITNRQIALMTGLHPIQVSQNVSRLKERGIIRVNEIVKGYKRIISINKDFETWRGLTDSLRVNEIVKGGLTESLRGDKRNRLPHPIKETITKETLTKERARGYFTEKLGYELGSRLESLIYDFKRTRKSNTIAPGVIKKIVDTWVTYGANTLLEAKKIWDEKRYAQEGKDEKYFAGILRRLAKEQGLRRASRVGGHE